MLHWALLEYSAPSPLPLCSGGIPSGSMPTVSVLKSVKENSSLVRDGNEAGVELGLIQPFLLSEVVFTLTRIVQAKFP